MLASAQRQRLGLKESRAPQHTFIQHFGGVEELSSRQEKSRMEAGNKKPIRRQQDMEKPQKKNLNMASNPQPSGRASPSSYTPSLQGATARLERAQLQKPLGSGAGSEPPDHCFPENP